MKDAIVTVIHQNSPSWNDLDRTFTSFHRHNPATPMYVFVIGNELPSNRKDFIKYRLVSSISEFGNPLREVYFRRFDLINEIYEDIDYVLVVDSYDVLCLRELPDFYEILNGKKVAGAIEHNGSKHILGQEYTSNFINCGVLFWCLGGSYHIRKEIYNRGRYSFRTIADDQLCFNEVIFTKYFNSVTILPSHYNYRPDLLPVKRLGWPSVSTLDGIYIYHNSRCIERAKKMTLNFNAELPELTMNKNIPNQSHQLFERCCNRISNMFYPLFSFVGHLLKNTNYHCETKHTKHHTIHQIEYGGLYLVHCNKCNVSYTVRR